MTGTNEYIVNFEVVTLLSLPPGLGATSSTRLVRISSTDVERTERMPLSIGGRPDSLIAPAEGLRVARAPRGPIRSALRGQRAVVCRAPFSRQFRRKRLRGPRK